MTGTLVDNDDDPTLSAASLTLNEGQTVTLSAANFTVTDPDSTSFTFTVSDVAGGYFRLSSDPGTQVTRFTSADLAGNRVQFVDDGDEVAPRFTITANDGSANSNSLVATINYTPVNDPPVAVADEFTTNEDTIVSGNLLDANPTTADSDADGGVLTIIEIEGSSANVGVPILDFAGRGTLTVQADGSFTFDPTGAYDIFTSTGFARLPFGYTLSDGQGGTSSAQLVINVRGLNDAPTTTPVTLGPVQEDSGVLLITQTMLLQNARDPDFGARLTASNLQLSGKGTLVDNLNGTWNYRPAPNDDTSVSFSYTISDGTATVDGSATLDITPVNDAPTTSAVTLSPIQEDSGTLHITQAMLLVNASDVDGLAPKAVNLQKTAGLGQLVDNGDSTWSYTPAANDDTGVSFSYSVSDGTLSAAGTATLDITPVNDAPVAAADSALVVPGTPVSIAVLANDSDNDGGALRVVSTTQGNGGSVAIQPGSLTVLYTPNPGFGGADAFNYTVGDGAGGTATASVRVLVASVAGTNGNDALQGTPQVDFIVGLDGDDSIQARAGADFVDGGRGADTINGGDGADTLLGGDGPDTFVATGSELAGDQVDGGDGSDTLLIPSSMTIWPANFSFTNLEQISHNGLVVLHSGLVDLSALTLLPGSNNKIIGDVANNRIIGTKGDDNMSDTAGNDDLLGADGNDIIQAGVGQDTIYGGNGNDRLCGDRFTSTNDGARDTFVFDTPLNAATNVDQIVGFQASSQDLIMLAPSIFGAITGGATLGLDADEFRSINGGNAQDGNDFILFDPLTGNLFYDADGSGGGAKVLFATLVGLTGTLDVTDFVAQLP